MSSYTRRTCGRLALAASASAIALAIPTLSVTAHAQDANEDGEVRNEIIVTAQFREQRLQDTPLAITAVDAAMLEARNQDDVAAIAAQAPSVTLNQMGSAFGNSMGASIRGIGQFDFNPAYEPGVGMYVDDVYYPTLTGANFDLLDLERVEVLRGPQGTLTGRNSIGGAIKLFSQRPDDDNSGYVEASYGSRDRMELRGGANFALTDNLFARVSGVHKSQQGYVDQIDYGCANPGNAQGIAATVAPNPNDPDSCVVSRLGGTNYSGLRGALRYEGDSVDVMVIGDWQRSDQTASAESLYAIDTAGTGNIWGYQVPEEYLCGRYCTYASWSAPEGGISGGQSLDPRSQFTGWGLSGHVDVDLTDALQFQSITAYRQYENTFTSDDDYTPGLALAGNPEFSGGQGYNNIDFWFFSQELRLNGELSDTLDFTVGAYYSDQRSVYFTQQDIRYLGFIQFVGNDPINANTLAGFGTLIWNPLPDFTITAGARYTDEHKDYTFVRRLYDYSEGDIAYDIDALDGVQSVYNGNHFDWRLSADYRFSDQVLGYATVGTGFKGGGVTARPFLPQHATQGTFGPETVTAYELGLKTDLLDRRVRLNLAAFYNDYQNIQLALSDCTAYGGGPCAVVANAGDGEIWGVEAELFAEPVDGLTIDGSVSLMDSKFTDLDAAVGTSRAVGDPIVQPDFTASFGIQYQADLGNAGSITPRFDLSHRGNRFVGYGLDAAGTEYRTMPSYTLGNARLTWRNADEDLSLALEVTNLFDTYYNPTRFTALYSFTGTSYVQVGAPREWRLSVSKQF
jgi:iron complex outermembrane receptor protein